MRLSQVNFPGLAPTVDARRANQPFILDGKNFTIDVDGVNSNFGADILFFATTNSDGMRAYPGVVYYMPESKRTFLFNYEGVFEVKIDVLRINLIFNFEEPSQQLKDKYKFHTWSFAQFGTQLYFVHPIFGQVYFFDTATNTLDFIEELSGVIAVCKGANRLFYVTKSILGWSAIDDPTNITSSTITGAGFQALALVNVQDEDSVITCLPYTQGVITYTKQGYIRSRYVEALNPLQHRAFQHSVEMPFSQKTVIQVWDSSHIWLAKDGFYRSNWIDPLEKWQPLMGDHFQEILTRTILLSPSLYFSTHLQKLFVSFNNSEGPMVSPGDFNKSFVYNLETDAWSSFDLPHYYLYETNTNLQFISAERNSLWQVKKQVAITKMPAVDTKETLITQRKAALQDIGYYYHFRQPIDEVIFLFDSVIDLEILTEFKELSGIYSYAYQNLLAQKDSAVLSLPYISNGSEVFLGVHRFANEADIEQVSVLDEVVVRFTKLWTDFFNIYDFAIPVADALAAPETYGIDLETGTESGSPYWVWDWEQPEDGTITIDAQEALRIRNPCLIFSTSLIHGEDVRMGEFIELTHSPLIQPIDPDNTTCHFPVESPAAVFHALKFECREVSHQFSFFAVEVNLRPAGIDVSGGRFQ